MTDKQVDSVENSRRRFLKTAGKIAVYTPPMMLALSKPSFATFNKSGGSQHYYPSSKKRATRRVPTFKKKSYRYGSRRDHD